MKPRLIPVALLLTLAAALPCVAHSFFRLSSDRPASAYGPRQATVLPWDSARPFEITSETITFRDLDAEAVAFWRDFLDCGPETDAPLADDLAHFLALPPPSPEDAAALYARAFPDASPDAPPSGLPLPWAHAAAALLHAAGHTDAAVSAESQACCGQKRLPRGDHPQNRLRLRRRREAPPAGEHHGLYKGKRPWRIRYAGRFHPRMADRSKKRKDPGYAA